VRWEAGEEKSPVKKRLFGGSTSHAGLRSSIKFLIRTDKFFHDDQKATAVRRIESIQTFHVQMAEKPC